MTYFHRSLTWSRVAFDTYRQGILLLLHPKPRIAVITFSERIRFLGFTIAARTNNWSFQSSTRFSGVGMIQFKRSNGFVVAVTNGAVVALAP